MRRLSASIAAISIFQAGCVLTPEGTQSERDLADREGAVYASSYEARTLHEIPQEPSWRDILARGFQANGELEAAYFAWRSALDQIDIAGTWPPTRLNLGFMYMFSAENMKSWDRTTLTAGFDAMEFSFPGKTAQAAKVALAQARAAAERFRAVKFDVQQRVLFAWADYVRLSRELEVQREDVALRKVLADLGSISAATGGGQQRAVESRVSLHMAESDLADMEAELASMRAMLNAVLDRDPESPLGVSAQPEEHRVVIHTDAELIAIAAETFPEVAVFAEEVKGRRDALELARLQWIPDFAPSLSITGSVSQALGAMIVFPTTAPAIRAGIRAAESDLRAAEAMLRQRRIERIGEYVGLVITLRRAQDRAHTFRTIIEPAAQSLAEARMRAYEVGNADLNEVIEAQQMWLETRVIIARADAAAEKAIVDIECCLGVDLETVTPTKEGAQQ